MRSKRASAKRTACSSNSSGSSSSGRDCFYGPSTQTQSLLEIKVEKRTFYNIRYLREEKKIYIKLIKIQATKWWWGKEEMKKERKKMFQDNYWWEWWAGFVVGCALLLTGSLFELMICEWALFAIFVHRIPEHIWLCFGFFKWLLKLRLFCVHKLLPILDLRGFGIVCEYDYWRLWVLMQVNSLWSFQTRDWGYEH